MNKGLPLQFHALREAQERELERILDDLEKEVEPDKGQELIDQIIKTRSDEDGGGE